MRFQKFQDSNVFQVILSNFFAPIPTTSWQWPEESDNFHGVQAISLHSMTTKMALLLQIVELSTKFKIKCRQSGHFLNNIYIVKKSKKI